MRVPARLVAGIAAELALAIDRDVGHGARAVERHQGDDVLEAVGLHLDQRLAHAGGFHLEHAHRLAALHRRVGRRIVEGQGGEIDDDAALGQEVRAAAQQRQRLQAEEVELHQARGLDPLHVELGHPHPGLRIAVERHQLFEGTVADDDAGGVGRGVPVQALELLRDLHEAGDDRLLLDRLLELRLALDGLDQGDGVGRVLRHELGQLVDLPVGHLQHAADVAQHAAGEQRAEGDDLRHLTLAVALLHVLDHALAALDAEVDVEIRHRDALGIQEALEQQAEAERVEVGDEERPGHQGAGAGAAARTHRDVVVLGPLDEVRHDQEVAGKLHAHDDVELEGEAVAVDLLGHPGRGAVLGEAQFEAGLRLPTQLRRLVEGRRGRDVGGVRGGGGVAGGDDAEIRQDRLAGAHAIGAAHGDLDGGTQGVRQVGEERGHLGAGLEAVPGGQLAAAVVRDEAAIRDRQERVVGVVVALAGEERLVGGHHREAVRVRQAQQFPLDHALVGEAVAQDLDVEPVLAEGPAQLRQAAGGELGPALPQGAVEGTGGAARQGDQAGARLGQGLDADAGGVAQGDVEIGAAGQPQQVAVAGLVLRQHDDVGAAGLALPDARHRIGRLEGHGELEAGDRLDAGAGGLLGEFQRPEQVVGVGKREGRLPVGQGGLHDVADLQGPFQQGERRVNVEVDVSRVFDRGFWRMRAMRPTARVVVSNP